MPLFTDAVDKVFIGMSMISSVERKSVSTEDVVAPKPLEKGCLSSSSSENSLNLRKILDNM